VDSLAGGQPRLGQSVVLQQSDDGVVLLGRRDDGEAPRRTARGTLSSGHRPLVAGEHEAVARGRAVRQPKMSATACRAYSLLLGLFVYIVYCKHCIKYNIKNNEITRKKRKNKPYKRYVIPPEVTSSATLSTFKLKLKTYFFHFHFPARNISPFPPYCCTVTAMLFICSL